MTENRIIFLSSPSPRSGHNFVAETLRLIIDVQTPLSDRSEIPFGPFLKSIETLRLNFYGSEGAYMYLNDLIVNALNAEFKSVKTNYLIKYTSFNGSYINKKLFPDAFHILSFRDPKDCLISLFKGMRLKNNIKDRIKKILWTSGIYHYTYSRKYSKKVEKDMKEIHSFFIIRFEDIVKRDESALQSILDFFGSSISVLEFKEKIGQIDVLNSSFFKEETKSKHLWDAAKPTEKFNPISREHALSKLQLIAVKKGSFRLRRIMGYV